MQRNKGEALGLVRSVGGYQKARYWNPRRPMTAACLCVAFAGILNLIAKGFSVQRGPEKNPKDLPSNAVITTVYDGDTFGVRFENGATRKVRLIGVDAPELDDTRENVFFMSQMAKRFAFFHLNGKNVGLSYDWPLEDKYGRLLAYVWTDKGELFNELIILKGFAAVHRGFAFSTDYRKRLENAEKGARRNGEGLWRREPLPVIRASEATASIGRISSISFTPSRIQKNKSFVALVSTEENFQAMIPRQLAGAFGDLNHYLNKETLVTGFIEEYGGITEILVFQPSRLELFKLQ